MTGARTIVFCKDAESVRLVSTKLKRSKQIKALEVMDEDRGSNDILSGNTTN